jgi:hypothetical protein
VRKLLILAFVLAGACDGSPSGPGANSLTITSTSPAAGTSVTLPPSYVFYVPGGVVVPPGSGHLSAKVTMSVVDSVPWAQLNVYLLTGGTNNEYCGQNTPDAPTWQFLKRGWSATVNVTGFRIYRLPCDVTGIRAILHMRNNGSGLPPTGADVVAEMSVPTNIRIRQ